MGPLGAGRYASGTPSARVEGALADGTDFALPLTAAQDRALAPPWDPRGAHAWRRRRAPLPGSTTT